jgi:hypothetical protein
VVLKLTLERSAEMIAKRKHLLKKWRLKTPAKRQFAKTSPVKNL